MIGQPVAELETPAVVVDLGALERNVARAGAYAREHGLALWPHLKTHKTVAVAERQRAAGVAGFTAAKTTEAERFAAHGLGPLLLHYPVFGAAKWERLAAVAGEAPLTVALDSLAAAEGLDRALRARGTSAELLIELDVGMRRTGVADAAAALALAEGVERFGGAAAAVARAARARAAWLAPACALQGSPVIPATSAARWSRSAPGWRRSTCGCARRARRCWRQGSAATASPAARRRRCSSPMRPA